MKVAAWNNGAFQTTGAGTACVLGLATGTVALIDRGRTLILDLPNGRLGLRVKLSRSFWRDCPELRSAEIGQWLITIGHPRWRRGKPPLFTLTQVSGNHFRVA